MGAQGAAPAQSGNTTSETSDQGQENANESRPQRGSTSHRRGGFFADPPETRKEAAPKDERESQVDDEPEEQKEPTPQEKRKYKVKVSDKEVEVDEDELLRGYSLSKASTQKFEEAAKIRKETAALVNALKTKEGMFSILQKLGHDPRALAEEYLHEVIQDETMDPKDKALKDRERELEKYKQMEAKRAEYIKAKRLEKMTQAQIEFYNQEFSKALDLGGLPKTKEVTQAMAKHIKKAASEGWELTPTDAAALVKHDMEQISQVNFRNLSGDQLLEFLGEEAIVRALQARGARVKSPNDNLKVPDPDQQSKTKRSSSSHLSQVEWNRMKRQQR